ncbi:TetR family transcriptional regulator [Streptomyces piniterrae]|uniref:TetR family transcriptional regulator n=1 Tax=Streptomyces piniterrae TaxID=2571125 RepID=A0A4U0NFP4_9ACTN|nr:TetR family transcriptional regulator [Streptomyces piniterrae]TJZ52870.1 TetR family transcriptional regulator [Streptomyces piniterrae]
MATDQPTVRRRRDPERRIEEITVATERVIAARGIEGLTHRAVAEEAGVPLGATTYHFATKDDLIAAALQRAVDRFAGYLDDWVARRPALSPEQCAVLLADAVLPGVGPQRDQQVMEFELYLAALRRPALRPIADQYTQLSRRALSHYTDPDTAAAAAAALNGISLRALANSTPPARTEAETILRRILTPNPALPTPAGSPGDNAEEPPATGAAGHDA